MNARPSKSNSNLHISTRAFGLWAQTHYYQFIIAIIWVFSCFYHVSKSWGLLYIRAIVEQEFFSEAPELKPFCDVKWHRHLIVRWWEGLIHWFWETREHPAGECGCSTKGSLSRWVHFSETGPRRPLINSTLEICLLCVLPAWVQWVFWFFLHLQKGHIHLVLDDECWNLKFILNCPLILQAERRLVSPWAHCFQT